MKANPNAGKPPVPAMLVNVPRLVTAYFTELPDPALPQQRVAFGTSGHRGSSFDRTFNEGHVLAISQAICDYRTRQGIDGPLFLGIDTHALSVPAFASALEVLAANGVEVMLARAATSTRRRRRSPTPSSPTTAAATAASPTASSSRPRTIRRTTAASSTTRPTAARRIRSHRLDRGPGQWLLESGLAGVKRMPYRARRCAPPTTHRHDYRRRLCRRSRRVIDLDADPRRASMRMGVDPLGGAGVHYWARIAERYGLDLTVVNDAVDPDVPLHDARLGRPDPHGSVLALCDAAADRPEGPLRHRLRLRHRPRPAWHRHAQRRACCHRITTWRSRIDYLVPAPAELAQPTPRSARPSSAAR